VAAHYRTLYHTNPPHTRLQLRGLDPAARYAVTLWTSFAGPEATFERGGDELMAVGLGIEPADPLPDDTRSPESRFIRGDFSFRLFDLRRV